MKKLLLIFLLILNISILNAQILTRIEYNNDDQITFLQKFHKEIDYSYYVNCGDKDVLIHIFKDNSIYICIIK